LLPSIIYWLRLGRPLFLAGGVLLHTLGVVIALYEGVSFSPSAYLWGQVAVTAVQIMTHYSNDYFDLAADQANLTPTRWSGGSRILVDGSVSPRLALLTALLAAVVAVGAALYLASVVAPAPLTLPLLLLALALAWAYSAPPLRLHSQGVGELAAAALIAALTPLLGYYLQAGRFSLLPFLAVLPLALLQFTMLLAIEFPDAAGDRAVGKRTLVVRLGGSRAARLLLVALLAFFPLLLLLALLGLPHRVTLFLLLFATPGVLWLAQRVGQGRWADRAWWPWFGFFSVALLVGSATVELVAFASLWLAR
jgi:1,4-dihydroxy-2-naphthoate octaprenyltransferase